jgi:hypothetical protein
MLEFHEVERPEPAVPSETGRLMQVILRTLETGAAVWVKGRSAASLSTQVRTAITRRGLHARVRTKKAEDDAVVLWIEPIRDPAPEPPAPEPSPHEAKPSPLYKGPLMYRPGGESWADVAGEPLPEIGSVPGRPSVRP